MAKVSNARKVQAETTAEADHLVKTEIASENIKTETAKYVAVAEPATIALSASTEMLADIRKVVGLDITTLPIEAQNAFIKQHIEKCALAKQLAETEALKASKTERYEKKIEFYSNPEFKSFGITFPMSIDFPYTKNDANGELTVDPLGFKCKVWEFRSPIMLMMNEQQRTAIAAFLKAFGYDNLDNLDLARLAGEKAYKESLQRKSATALKKAAKVNLQTDAEIAESKAKQK